MKYKQKITEKKNKKKKKALKRWQAKPIEKPETDCKKSILPTHEINNCIVAIGVSVNFKKSPFQWSSKEFFFFSFGKLLPLFFFTFASPKSCEFWKISSKNFSFFFFSFRNSLRPRKAAQLVRIWQTPLFFYGIRIGEKR